MQLIDQPIRTIVQAHSTQILAAGTAAEIALDYLDVELPWWAHLGLLLLVLFGRIVKQPSISGTTVTEGSDAAQ